jgi:cation transport regulator ChaB
MPYASAKDVPPAVKKLPAHAATVWRKAFNNASKQPGNSEASSFKIAWSAVSNAGFHKGSDGKWRKGMKTK